MFAKNRKFGAFRSLALAGVVSAYSIGISQAAVVIDIVDSDTISLTITSPSSLTTEATPSLQASLAWGANTGTTVGGAPTPITGGFTGGSVDPYNFTNAGAPTVSVSQSGGTLTGISLASGVFGGSSTGMTGGTLTVNFSAAHNVTTVNTLSLTTGSGTNTDLVSAVPEPSGLLLSGLGVLAVGLRRRRR